MGSSSPANLSLAGPTPLFSPGITLTGFHFGESSQPPGTSGRPSVLAADLNRDGKMDLVVGNPGENSVSLLLGRGDGTFAPARIVAVGTDPGALAVGDFTGDGRLDLVVADAVGGSVSILPGNGDGSFAPARSLAVGPDPSALAAGDLNGDGRPDLVVANAAAGSVSILLGNGDGSFRKAPDLRAIPHPSALAVGDFTGDGRPDLAVADSAGNSVSILPGRGDGTFAPARMVAAGADPAALAVGDFTGDGRSDLVVADAIASSLSVLLNNGDGTFAPAQMVAAGADPAALAVGDFTGDGRPDLAVANALGNSVSVLLNTGAGRPGGGTTSTGQGTDSLTALTPADTAGLTGVLPGPPPVNPAAPPPAGLGEPPPPEGPPGIAPPGAPAQSPGPGNPLNAGPPLPQGATQTAGRDTPAPAGVALGSLAILPPASPTRAMAASGGGFEVQRDFNLRLGSLAPDISLELTDRADLLSGAELVGSLLTGTSAATLLPRKTSALAPVATVLEGEGGTAAAVPGDRRTEEDPAGFVIGLDDTIHRQHPLPPSAELGPRADAVFQQFPFPRAEAAKRPGKEAGDRLAGALEEERLFQVSELLAALLAGVALCPPEGDETGGRGQRALTR